MKKNPVLLFVLLLLLGIGAGALYYFSTTRYKVTITQEQIDKTLRAKFPFSKTVLGLVHIQFANPVVTLLPASDRIQVSVEANLAPSTQEGAKTRIGTLVATTGIRYNAETRQFFLSNIEIQNFTLIGVSQNIMEKAKPLIAQGSKAYLETHPVYTIVDKNAGTKLARMLLKDIQVTNQEIHITLGLK